MNKRTLTIPIVVCALSLIAMCISLFYTASNENIEFIPPNFEENISIGTPKVEESLKYQPIAVRENYTAYLCSEMVVKNQKCNIYFTNDANNDVWLKLRILNESDEIIAETGIIKQGEYLKTIQFKNKILNEQTVKLKIMAYEPKTYHSEGTIIINNQVKIGE